VSDYELLEHTADIAVKIEAKGLKSLFVKAARAMFDIIAKKPRGLPASAKKNFTVCLRADNLNELFIDWLNELLSLSAAKELIFSEFKIDKLDSNNLKARFSGKAFGDYKLETEIKAATYHEMEIKKSASGWEVKVIFDV
jgi:SHS2 domain-containing protein